MLGESQGKYIFMMIILTYVYMVTTLPFNYEITSKPHIFIQSLPVEKSEIVISKYILVFINYIVATVLAVCYLWVINTIGFKKVEYFNLNIFKISLPIVMIMLSLSLPAYFKLPPRIANMTNIFIYVFFLSLVSSTNGLLEKLDKGCSLDKFNQFWIILTACIVMVISMLVSINLYRNKDLS